MNFFTVDIQAKRPPIHVYPVNDKIKHETEGEYCQCMPEIRIEGDSLIVVHNLLDSSN